MIIGYGALWAKDHEIQNAKDWEKIVKENSSVEGQIAILEAIKGDLGREDPTIKPDLLNGIIPLAPLQKILQDVIDEKNEHRRCKILCLLSFR